MSLGKSAMLKKFISYLFQSPLERKIKKQTTLYQTLVSQIEALSNTYLDLDDEAFQIKVKETIEYFKNLPETERSIQARQINNKELVDTFALIQEASRRQLGLKHYSVQLMGGLALAQQLIAEMQTGEGKTLTAGLPAIYYALKTQKQVHIVTANNYLAERDSQYMKPLFELFGLSVSFNFMPESIGQLKDKANVFKADIVYSSANELTMDYLRSSTQTEIEKVYFHQNDMNYVIIDEADFILLDSARETVILADRKPFDGTHLKWARDTALKLTRSDVEYQSSNRFMEKQALADMTQEEIEAMREKEENGDEYQVDGMGNIINGNFFANEVEQQIIFFEEAYEIIENSLKEYGHYDPNTVPHFQHMVEQALMAEYILLKDRDYMIVDNQVIMVNLSTGRAMPMTRWEGGLHQSIEFKENVPIQDDSRMMASITYQSFFNQYPYKAGMTGTAQTEAEELMNVYGLTVFPVPTHLPSRRMDTRDILFKDNASMYEYTVKIVQERLNKGQPVLIGTPTIQISEELAEYFNQAQMPFSLLNAKNIRSEAQIIAQAGKPSTLTIATNMAGRGTDIILGGDIKSQCDELDHLFKTNQINEAAYQKRTNKAKAEWQERHDAVVDSGGLLIIGVGLAESRRTSNQLKGRAGRQGDVGESMSFYSLEDRLIVATTPSKTVDFIVNQMEQMQINSTADIPPQYDFMWGKVANKTQRMVEGVFAQQRKSTLRYESIQNQQRLLFNKMKDEILLLKGDEINDIFHEYCHEFMTYEVMNKLNVEKDNLPDVDTEIIVDTMIDILDKLNENTQTSLRQEAQSIIDGLNNLRGKDFENGISDMLNAGALAVLALHDLRWRTVLSLEDPNVQTHFIQRVLLNSMSEMWYDYVANMELLKMSSQFAVYAKKEPFHEFSESSHRAFMNLLDSFPSRAVYEVFAEPMIDKAEINNILEYMKMHNVDATKQENIVEFLNSKVAPVLFQQTVLGALNEEHMDKDVAEIDKVIQTNETHKKS